MTHHKLNAALKPLHLIFSCQAMFTCRNVPMAQSMKTHLKKSMKSSFLMEVSIYANLDPIKCNHSFSDATSYAHHVFKAFDVESNGSINFKVRKADLFRFGTF